MARYKNGINGAFSGKVGTVVGATCRGVDYIRGLPDVSQVATTRKQRDQRLKFALVMGWLRPLLELLKVGYRVLTGSTTPMNRAVSYHLKEAVTGEGPDYAIDFKKAIFSRGELLLSWILEIVCLVNAVLNIKWENGPESAFCKDTDQASFIIYNPEKQEFVTFPDVALRAEKEIRLQLPAVFSGDTVHGWMHYANKEGDAVSTSLYLGSLQVG